MLYLGCTKARHKQIGIDAVVNARGGLQHLNDRTERDWQLYRDSQKVKNRIYVRRFESKVFRKRMAHKEHGYAED